MLKRLFKATKREKKWKTGALYSVPNHGGYNVIKVLKVEKKGLHVRFYSNRYSTKPTQINESELYISSTIQNNTVGQPHYPLSYVTLETWRADFIQQSSVSPEELESYHQWKRHKRGFH